MGDLSRKTLRWLRMREKVKVLSDLRLHFLNLTCFARRVPTSRDDISANTWQNLTIRPSLDAQRPGLPENIWVTIVGNALIACDEQKGKGSQKSGRFRVIEFG